MDIQIWNRSKEYSQSFDISNTAGENKLLIEFNVRVNLAVEDRILLEVDLDNITNSTIESKVHMEFEYYIYRKRHNLKYRWSINFIKKNIL